MLMTKENEEIQFKFFIDYLDDFINRIFETKDVWLRSRGFDIEDVDVYSISINTENMHYKFYDLTGQHFSDSIPIKQIIDIISTER